jgi:hypothetical protein
MSAGFDDRVEARLIGLRMAADAPDELSTIITGSSNKTSSLQETDNQSILSDQSATSSMYNSTSSNSSFTNNAPITARR